MHKPFAGIALYPLYALFVNVSRPLSSLPPHCDWLASIGAPAIPAVWHAAKSVVELLDTVQKRFLRELDLTEEEAPLRYNLAPLSCRRDMAALGLIHRAALGKGPAHFRKWLTASTHQMAYDIRYQGGRHTK